MVVLCGVRMSYRNISTGAELVLNTNCKRRLRTSGRSNALPRAVPAQTISHAGYAGMPPQMCRFPWGNPGPI